ncbi:MAG: filamentous hemagglutinin family protein [Betaproteobacteria bacterium]
MKLSADAGDVSIAAGAALDLSSPGSAGRLSLLAPNGAVTLAGSVNGVGIDPGSATVDAKTLPDLTGLNRSLNEGGMTGARVIRQRTGELKVAAGEIVKASHVSLSADTGNITLEGTVDVSGAAGGGRAGLFAGQDLTLASGSLIDARGTSQGTGGSAPIANGGTVEVSAARGLLNFQPGATVDVSAGAKGDAGSVTFAAARTAVGTSLPITLAGTLDATPGASGAAASVVVRGDRAYTLSSLTTSTTNTFTSANPVWNEYNNFMSNAPAFSVSGTNASVRAGIEIRSPADLTLGSVWDLTNSNWNRNGVPALLTLRATGNLNINSTLGLPDPPTTGTIGNQALPTGQSWSMRLVGGADMGAANPLAVVPLTTLTAAGKGDVVLQDNNTSSIGKVRTGSGDIEIAAGRDFRLGDSSLATNGNRAVVYTAGIAQVPSSVDPTQRFTSGGGDVRITAQRDAVGSMVIAPQVDSNGNPTNPIGKAGEFVNDWLRRTSLPAGSSSAQRLVELPGSWWVYRPNFRGNIGSFGGGDIAVVAGRDVVNLGASAPTSGRGSVDTASNTAVGSVVALAPDAAGNAVLEVRGGGNVGVSAGRNIQGGEYLVALGTGNISATGSVGAGGSPTGLFLMGQGNVGLGSDTSRSSASIQVAALGNVTLQSISNPTILASTQPTATSGNRLATVGFGGSRDAFFTYAPDSEAQVISVNGDVTVGRAAMVKPSSTTPSIISAEWSTVAPPKLLLAAMSGSVTQTGTPGDVTRPIDLYPSTTGQLAVFAGKDVVNLNATAFNVVPDALPLWNHPGAGGGVNTSYTLGSGVASVAGRTTAGTVGDLFAASLPRLTTSDATSGRTLYAVEAGGDVLSPTLQMPARSSVRAGRDLVSGVLNAQNLSAADVSVVAAGRDIVADPLRYKGDPSKSLGINFAGPGTGVVQSGRNIDLGSSTGIVADGSARNGSLNTNTSARLVVLAGVKGIVDVNVIDSLMSVSRLFGLMSAASSAKAVRGPDVKAAIAAADSRDPASLQRLDDALAATLVVPDQVKDVTDAALAAREALASVRFAIARGAQPALLDTLLSGLGVVSGVDRLPVAVSGATNVLSTGNVAGTDAANQFLAGAIQLANTELRSTAGVRNTVSVGGATLLVAPDPAKAFATVAFANNATGPGNIDMFSTKLQTTGGSGIDLVAPGFNAAGKSAGVVNAGLPSGSKGNVGITTQAGGAIRAYVSSDFNVNQSKVLTAQGGDIMLYTSDGNIDAGRGALTSRSSSPPRRVAVFNNNGEFIGFVYLPPIDATGSGIRTLTSDPDGPGPQFAPPAGNIYLFATKGKIDAGEAGIASGGSITVRGDVANAGNISGSNASGVPSTVSTSVGALAGPGPGTTKRDGDDPTKGLPPTAAGPAENAPRLAILSVEVLRFGEGPDEQPASRTAGPQKPDETRRGR